MPFRSGTGEANDDTDLALDVFAKDMEWSPVPPSPDPGSRLGLGLDLNTSPPGSRSRERTRGPHEEPFPSSASERARIVMATPDSSLSARGTASQHQGRPTMNHAAGRGSQPRQASYGSWLK